MVTTRCLEIRYIGEMATDEGDAERGGFAYNLQVRVRLSWTNLCNFIWVVILHNALGRVSTELVNF